MHCCRSFFFFFALAASIPLLRISAHEANFESNRKYNLKEKKKKTISAQKNERNKAHRKIEK